MSREGACRMLMLSDNSAISTVVSFMLILGLLITVVAFVKVQYVPSWTEDVEARHARDVFIEFSLIPGRIDDLVLANGSITVSQNRIKLGSGGIPIMAPGRSYGTLGVVPDEGSFTVTADVWNVNITGNGTSDSFTVGGVNITNVSSVSAFDLSYWVVMRSGGNPSGEEVSVNITTNRSGATNQDGGARTYISDFEVRNMTTWNSDGDKILDGVCIDDGTRYNTSLTIDLLNPRYGFCKVLSDADVPYNFTITNTTNVSGWYCITYNEYNRTLEPYTETTNGTMMYESRNRQFINQQFIYQNGAVFLCQPPYASMRVAPGITIEDVKNYTRVMIPMVSLGVGRYRIPMVSGSGVEELQLELNHVNRSSFADGNNTDNVSILIEPPIPADDLEFRKNYLQEWADYFDAAVNGTGVDANPTNATNWDNITIKLTGNIHLEVRDVDVEGRISNII